MTVCDAAVGSEDAAAPDAYDEQYRDADSTQHLPQFTIASPSSSAYDVEEIGECSASPLNSKFFPHLLL